MTTNQLSSPDEALANKFTRLFFPWQLRPGRDQAWYESVKASAEDRFKFEKEYSGSLEVALRAPQSLMYFVREALELMEKSVRPPMFSTGAFNATNVWEKFVAGQRYCAFSDTAHGVGQDNSTTCIWNATKGAVIADVDSSMLKPEELALESYHLLKDYEFPLWGIEDNEAGGQTVHVAKDLHYPNLWFKEMDTAGVIGKSYQYSDTETVGWHTNQFNRAILWGDLGRRIAANQVTVYSKTGLNQFFEIIRNAGKDGKSKIRIEARYGAHDDYPICVAGCIQLEPFVKRPRAAGTPRSYPIEGGW